MKQSVQEYCFGVQIFVGDKCFVLYEHSEPRVGTVESISDDDEVAVAMDDGSREIVIPDRLTLSFALFGQNEARRK